MGSSWSKSSVSYQQVAGPAAASRRSSTYWSRVEAGCDIPNPAKYFCSVSPKSLGEVLMLGAAISRIVSLDIGSVYSEANRSWLTGAGGMEKEASLRSRTG